MPNIIKLTPSLCGCSPIQIGYRVENDARAIEFDFSEWADEYGSGAVELLVKRKGDTAAYPVALEIDGTVAVWNISDTDTSAPGYGKAEYTYTVGTTLAKTAVFTFFVAEDLADTTQDPPDPYQTWVDTLTSLGAETLGNAIRAEDAADRAEDAQAAAEQTASEAAQYAQEASESATAAAQSAGAARDMAASALSSADRATASATSASGHATAAEAAKDLAISAAESAQHSETQAELSASAAAESAESASGSAATATTAAQNASQSASAASGSASAAATSAEQAAESAEKADIDLLKLLPTDTASGAIASFSDGADNVPVEALTVQLEPIQDLNGQSSPYPAGASANKQPCGEAFTQTVNGITITSDGHGVYTLKGTATAAVNYLFDIPEVTLPDTVIVHLMNDKAGSTGSAIGFDWYNGSTRVDFAGLYPVNRIYYGTSALGGKTINKLAIRVANGEAISGTLTFSPMILDTNTTTAFIPYENICPITGHTAAQLWRSGVNVWDEEWEVGTFLNTNGTKYPSTKKIRSKNPIYVKPNTTYYYYVGSTSADEDRIWCYDADMNFIRSFTYTHQTTVGATFTTPSNCAYINFAIKNTTYNNDISINYPSTDHDYHAHSIVNISIPLGQTVYGGSIDVVGGVCKVDRAMVDMGTLNWVYQSSYQRMQTGDLTDIKYADSNYNAGNLVCSMYVNSPAASSSHLPKSVAVGASASVGVVVYDDSYTDAATFKTAVTGQQLVYELATPIEIPLTAHELTTLLGQNNIWSDSGDVDVTYRADIQKYITKVISEALA